MSDANRQMPMDEVEEELSEDAMVEVQPSEAPAEYGLLEESETAEPAA